MKERKPNPDYPNCPEEDLFLCWKCSKWLPWFLYTRGFRFSSGNENHKNLQEHIDYGHRWACDYCCDESGLYQCNNNTDIWTTINADYYKNFN